MTPTRVYNLVPEIACKGLCADSCGPIGMSQTEFEALGQPELAHMTEGGAVFMPPLAPSMSEVPNCPLLKDARCTAYEKRPLICRLWGVVATMPCPHGCKPKRYLKDAEGRALLAMID